MTRKMHLGMVALAAFAALFTDQVKSDEPTEVVQVSTMNLATQFASMQAELEQLRARQGQADAILARFEQVSFGGETGCSDCGKGKCDDCGAGCGCNCFCDIGCGGIYGGAEAVVVRPHMQHETDFNVFGAGGQFDPRFDYSVSPRIFLGWRNCRGTGIRARYWMFDQTTSPIVVEDEDVAVGLDVQALDLEFTQLVCWGPLNSNFALGVRYGSVENTLSFDDGDDYDEFRTQFDGWGPTMAMENRIPIGCSNLSVVGNLRGSLLFGDTHYTVLDDDPDPFTLTDGRDDLVAVAEMQVGLEWSRCTSYGVFSAYALLEGQYWAGAIGNLALDELLFPLGGLVRGFSTDQDLGFVGGTFGVQLAR